MKETSYPQYVLGDFQVSMLREFPLAVDRRDVDRFVLASGDAHPLHVDHLFARSRGYPDVVVHGMCIAARCSMFVAKNFVGSHGLLVSLHSDFRLPVFCGEPLTWRGEVIAVNASASTVEIEWQVLNERGLAVQRGTACVLLPRDR